MDLEISENNSNTENSIEDSIYPLCNGLNYYESNYKFSDIDLINLEIKNSRDWYTNLYKIIISDGSVIKDKYKKRFDATLTLQLSNGLVCDFKSKVRVSGDYKDHIIYGNSPVASLDVKLIEGNILGITKFKLLLKDTRGGDEGRSEVFVTTILNHLGYITPRTALLDVSVNNSYSEKYIFQEKLSKEMIEYNNFREGPLVETSEDFIDFENINNQENFFIFGKITNNSWANSSIENLDISSEALSKYNFSIFSSYNPKSQMNYEMLSSNIEYLLSFDLINFALNSNHGITNHNRKFYYDKITGNFIPVYYDGNSNFLTNSQIALRDDYIITLAHKIAAKKLYDSFLIDPLKLMNDLSEKNLVLEVEKVYSLLNQLENNLLLISQIDSDSEITNLPKATLNALEIDNDLHFYYFKKENIFFEKCTQINLNCETVQNNYLKLEDILEELNANNSILFGQNSKNTFTILNNLDYEEIEISPNIFLRKFGSANIRIQFEEKIIDILITNIDQKVLITGSSVLDNWTININSQVKNTLPYRQDENLLTGCITFANIEILNLIIKSTNQHCEDAINFYKVNGTVENIEIVNSNFDGLDIDFSDVLINHIYVENANNDCLDVSGGNYVFQNLILNKCQDKAISAGESTKLEIVNLNISNSNIGVAIKDSSIGYILNFDSTSLDRCLALYQKKQEFGPVFLEVINNNCKDYEKNYIQSGSVYKNG